MASVGGKAGLPSPSGRINVASGNLTRMTTPPLLIGIDIGGTFTDAVVIDGSSREVLQAFKLPSTPSAPATAVLTAVRRIAETFDVRGAAVCHGTTIGTNALIERNGARTALIATSGFTDVIELRRQDRPNLYDLSVTVSEPLVEADHRLGALERMDAAGGVVRPLEGIAALLERITDLGVQSIAISLLHCYANPAHEQMLKAALQARFPDTFLTLSSEICPEYGEYERTSTAVVNAYIGPPVRDYLRTLKNELAAMGVDQLLIVKSNGGLTSADNAAQFPAHLIESGPAAGVMASAAYGLHVGRRNTIAFDMGGTTAKAGVISDYTPQMTSEFKADSLKQGRNVGGYPIRSAVLDIVEIGSGGGSIAWIDAGGIPKVGPESAGADPGPACYSRGGSRPTVTDAHAVIGTLCGQTFAGTGVVFDRSLAVEAVRRHIAAPLNWSVEKAAYAIIDIAVADMNEMVKLATVRRGRDPRDFSLIASGGAGPLHAALVGSEIGAAETIVPPYSGMFSALGATLGQVKHNVSRTLLSPLADLEPTTLVQAFDHLAERARALLDSENARQSKVVITRGANCRYIGQLYELEVPLGEAVAELPTPEMLERAFREIYRTEFGFELPQARVELVKAHMTIVLEPQDPRPTFAPTSYARQDRPPLRRQAYVHADGTRGEIAVYGTREHVGLDAVGPLVVEHAGSTVWVRGPDPVRIHSDGSVVITHQRGEPR